MTNWRKYTNGTILKRVKKQRNLGGWLLAYKTNRMTDWREIERQMAKDVREHKELYEALAADGTED